jgi:hypothetical protein
VQQEERPWQSDRHPPQLSVDPEVVHTPAALHVSPDAQVPQLPPQPSDPHLRPLQLAEQEVHCVSLEPQEKSPSTRESLTSE